MIASVFAGKKLVEQGVPFTLKLMVEGVSPENFDQERFEQLVDEGWAQFRGSKSSSADLMNANEYLIEDFTTALEDQDLSADEFDFLVDRFNEILFDSEKDADLINELKQLYRDGKVDDTWTTEEMNAVMDKAEEVLNS